MLILSDVHIGFNRKGGVTPASAEALRTYLFGGLRSTLNDSNEEHLVVPGDLFDDFEIASRDWLETYSIFAAWLQQNAHRTLTLIAGNHDVSPRALRVSSFQMLCDVLRHVYGARVQVVPIDTTHLVETGVYAVAHCSNQDRFNERLLELLATVVHGDHVLLHANYSNDFAAQSDHSLNVSQEMAKRFIDKGVNLVFAHEHQARREMPVGAKQTGAEVIVLGNQWSTSIADCLGNKAKFAHTLNDGRLAKVQTWSADDPVNGYTEIDWQDLGDQDIGGFVRVVGEATSPEASDVINRIAKFRQRSKAFVITNAVKIDGIVQAEELPEQFEVAKRFDVMEFVRKHLTAEEFQVVEELAKERV